MYDLDDDPETASQYECMACGEIVTAETRPNTCPECNQTGSFQNRAFSLE